MEQEVNILGVEWSKFQGRDGVVEFSYAHVAGQSVEHEERGSGCRGQIPQQWGIGYETARNLAPLPGRFKVAVMDRVDRKTGAIKRFILEAKAVDAKRVTA